MLLPHEIKKDNFTKVMRGYSPVEVDEYIDFVVEKYSELYRENDELERKLKAALVKLEESHVGEDEVKNTIINARHAADKIIDEANERSDILVEAAMNRCNAILSDFSAKVKKSKEAISLMKKEVDAFKTALYVKYNDHIEDLEQLTEFLGSNGTVSSYTSQVIEGVKHDLEETISRDPEEYFIERESYKRPEPVDVTEDDADIDNIPDDVEEIDCLDTDIDDDSFGGTPDGDFIPEQDDYLYEDDEPFTHTSERPVVLDTADEDEDDDAKEFAAHAKSSLFGKKNEQPKDNQQSKKSDPLSLTDEFELVYSNDDDILS